MNADAEQLGTLGPGALDQILDEMMDSGDFEVVVLASADGLPIAISPRGYDSETAAAMMALLLSVGRDAQRQLGMEALDEVSLYDERRVRFVSRCVTTPRETLILAARVLPNRPYRRAMNRALQRIETLLG